MGHNSPENHKVTEQCGCDGGVGTAGELQELVARRVFLRHVEAVCCREARQGAGAGRLRLVHGVSVCSAHARVVG